MLIKVRVKGEEGGGRWEGSCWEGRAALRSIELETKLASGT